jgi:hypothetical protein
MVASLKPRQRLLKLIVSRRNRTPQKLNFIMMSRKNKMKTKIQGLRTKKPSY